MSYQHNDLAAGRWSQLTFLEQMANIGSEVERALNWRAKHHAAYAQRAFERALELMDFTLGSVQSSTRLKELARARETIVDFFWGANHYGSTEALWRSYFSHFTYAARKDH